MTARLALAAGLFALLAAAANAATPASAPPGAKLPAFEALPDWSGVWIGKNGPTWAGDPPPLTPAWAKKYADDKAKAAIDRFPDPVSFCGTPSGFPRLMSIPDGYEFVFGPSRPGSLPRTART